MALLEDDLAREGELIRGGEQPKIITVSTRPSEGRSSNLISPTIPLKEDNQGSIELAHNLVFHSRTKHIDIQHHNIRDEVAAGKIDLTYIPTELMIPDSLTKPLTHAKFHEFLEQMHMA